MPRRPPLLVRAARTRIREDRLTELLRVVLLGHEKFAHRLLRRAGLPAVGPVEVRTQVRTRRGKRVDMEVLVYDEDGRHPVGRLWSEHKTGSRFSPGQLEGYAEELCEFSGPTQLITITDRLGEVEDDPRWMPLIWAQVGRMAVELGRAGGRLWRQDACKDGADGGARLLHELLSYLEEDRYIVLDPLSHLDIIAFARANHVSAVLTSLLDRAGEYSRYETDGDAEYGKDDWGLCTIAFSIPGSWPAKLDGAFELLVSDDDEFACERVGEPAFSIGAWLPIKYTAVLRGTDTQVWRDGITTHGFAVSVGEDDYPRVTKTMYAAEILANGPLLDSQAHALARWADEAIATLSAADPGLAPIPDSPKKKPGEAAATRDRRRWRNGMSRTPGRWHRRAVPTIWQRSPSAHASVRGTSGRATEYRSWSMTPSRPRTSNSGGARDSGTSSSYRPSCARFRPFSTVRGRAGPGSHSFLQLARAALSSWRPSARPPPGPVRRHAERLDRRQGTRALQRLHDVGCNRPLGTRSRRRVTWGHRRLLWRAHRPCLAASS